MGKINETGRLALGLRGPRSALCNGGNYIPKYLLPVYRPHRCLSISGNGTNHERAIISRNLDSDGVARRDVPSKFAGSGFGGGVIDFPHRIVGAHRVDSRMRGRTGERREIEILRFAIKKS